MLWCRTQIDILRQRGLSRREAQRCLEHLKSLETLTLYDEVAKGYGCPIDDAKRYVSEFIELAEKSLGGSDLNVEVLSALRRQMTGCHFEENARADSCEWLKNYVKSSWWMSVGSMEDAEYFNPFCKMKSNYRCWQNVPPVPVEGIVFARSTAKLRPPEYLLIKPGENTKVHRIDSFFQEMGEYRRFQFVLRGLIGNNLTALYYD